MVDIAAMTDPAHPPAAPAALDAGIDPRRYRQVRRFLLRVLVHALWWDLVLNNRLLRRFRRPPLARWTVIARRFRRLAIAMGGVLIKLGQFLSTRVDLFPPEVTRELGGLQDEVPAAPFAAIRAQIEDDFGRPLAAIFAHFEPRPLGAASLAQAHRARLVDGGEVVVKVLRPGIDVLVATDLRVVALAVRWFKLWRRIRRRVDLDRLSEEFATTTRAELDLVAEGRNAERFAADFATDRGVHVPRVYWPQSARRTLTLENVAWIKIDDLAALTAAGIDPAAVADKLYATYLGQVFDYSFVHADPHPGNLFVRPLGPPQTGKPRAFQIAFVDFGMVAEIPQPLRAALREFLIGLGTRDPYRMVYAYQEAGMLLPGADLKRLEDAHEAVLRRLWGVPIAQLRDAALSEMSFLFQEYRDLIIEAPFQVQVDLLFVNRAMGVLLGLITHLDPDFDLWAPTKPFAKRLLSEGLEIGPELVRGLLIQARSGAKLPQRLDRFLTRTERGDLEVQGNLGPDARRAVQRLERAVARLTWVAVAAGLLAAGSFLYAGQLHPRVATVLMVAAGVAFLWAMTRRS